MTKLELVTLIDTVSKNKHKLKHIKDETTRFLLESIVSSRVHKQVIKELSK